MADRPVGYQLSDLVPLRPEIVTGGKASHPLAAEAG
jgi:hypothetical protein